VESASIAQPPVGGVRETSGHGLERNAIGFGQGLVIALASTAPAYSIAAVIGVLVLQVGVQAPATLLAAFIPMVFIASAFLYMNRADPDCGTTFSWVARAMGPWAGWFAGWAVTITGVLVIGSLADVAARYLYLTVGWDSAAESRSSSSR
jgi:amino acid transporter